MEEADHQRGDHGTESRQSQGNEQSPKKVIQDALASLGRRQCCWMGGENIHWLRMKEGWSQRNSRLVQDNVAGCSHSSHPGIHCSGTDSDSKIEVRLTRNK